jgi:protoheme IX farnesyltransferase
MVGRRRDIQKLKARLRAYWKLTKSLQTGLLLFTGLAGYASARCPALSWREVLGLVGSLFLAISGSTVLNMWYDRDIDAKMDRTCMRPIPSGQVGANEALLLGLVLSALGVGWSFNLSPIYATVVAAGLFFDVVIYTIALKRRTAWSIIWGGIAGGMPALAGRTLGTGSIDWVGLTLFMAVLFWIPTHIMTFNLRYREDYARAAVPTFPSTYGVEATRVIIALSSIAAAIAVAIAAYGIGMTWGYLRVLIVLSAGLLILASSCVLRPSGKINFSLFKYASVYMLSSMLLFILEGM